LSRIGRVVGVPEDVPLDELISDVVGSMQGSLADRGVLLDVASDLPTLHADRTRLHEVFQNLLENAVKYLGDQPEPHIEVGTRKDGEETVCFVRDNGIGVDPRYQEKIFGLFEQLDKQVEGTGVGLTAVKRIIEFHGGRIWCESQGEGHGSTFCFVIPPETAAEA